MITVNTNMSSIIAQNSLYKSTNKMNTALQRLSTGLRINSAKDDAAGSAISTKLSYKISSYNVAKDNAQMGQSMLETANGSLSKINSMLQRIRDLSEQASNGTYGLDERKAMQAEIDGLTEEIYRIKNTTEFNGKKILGEEQPKIQRITEAEAIAQGYTVVKTAEEFQEAFYKQQDGGNFDKVDGRYIRVTAGTGHYAQKVNDNNCKIMLFANIDLNELGFDETGSNWTGIGSSDNTWHKNDSFRGVLDGNGYTISNLTIKENGTNEYFTGLINVMYGENAKVKNLNLDNVYIDSNKKNVGAITGWNRNASVIENCNVLGYIKGSLHVGLLSGICNAESKIINCTSSGFIEGTESGGISGEILGNSFIENCYSDCKIIGSKSGSFAGRIYSNATISNSYCDLEKSGQTNFVGYNQDGTSTIDVKDSKTNPFATQEMQVKTNLQVGINSDSNSTITVDTGFSLGDLNISVLNEFSARNSLSKIDEMMDKITSKMTEIGATQNRLTSTMEFQDVQINALTSANSIIQDANIAEESSNYIKNQILQNVTSSLLATANQNPQIALQLI